MTYTELEAFYHDLVRRARERGVTCAITSGMACVHYGVAQTTKDCDLLCDPKLADAFLGLITETDLNGAMPSYRGNLSPPLDRRWLEGGWTSHFVWETEDGDGAYLDIFGVPPRASAPWEKEIEGFYSSRHTVAEMKRTDRDKDWPFATALGEQMLEAGDEQGWLHVFDVSTLLSLNRSVPPPLALQEKRPVLSLLADTNPDEIELAIRAEKEFWHQLDAVRVKVLKEALRPYVVAVRKDPNGKAPSLKTQHEVRLEKAKEVLNPNALTDYGHRRMAEEARERAEKFLPAGSHPWLPDVSAYLTDYSDE